MYTMIIVDKKCDGTMKKNIIKIVGLLSLAVTAYAEKPTEGPVERLLERPNGNWSLGAGALVSANPYQSMKTNILAIPFISYQGKYFVLYGPIAKARYALDKNNIIGLRFQLGMQTFKPGDTSLKSLQKLNERKRLFFVGPYYRLRWEYGQFTSSFGYDVSNRSSGGMLVDFQYGYPLFLNSRRLFLRPGIGLTWFNDKIGKNYYQITPAESAISGLAQYAPSSYVQPSASLFAGIRITKKLFWTNIVRVNYLPNTVANSPMVANKRITYSLITGITYEIGNEKQRFNH